MHYLYLMSNFRKLEHHMVCIHTVYFYRAGGDSFSNCVSGFAHVSAGVLSVCVQDVQSNVSKVVRRLETMTLLYGPSIAVPLDAHGRVIDRRQCCFQVYRLALSHLRILQGLSELWFFCDETLVTDDLPVPAVIL